MGKKGDITPKAIRSSKKNAKENHQSREPGHAIVIIEEPPGNPEQIARLIKNMPDGRRASFIIKLNDVNSAGEISGVIEELTGLSTVEVKGMASIESGSVYLIPRGIIFSVTESKILASGVEEINVPSAGETGALFEEGLRLRSGILARINDAVISVDNDEKITFFNPAAEKLYKVKSGDALGSKLSDITHYRFLSEEEKNFAHQSLRKRGLWKGEGIHLNAEGRQLYVESSVSLVRDSEGKVIGQQAVIHDITARKELEISLQEKEEMLTNALYSARMFAFEWDPETDEVVRTRQCADILGIRDNPTRDSSRNYFEQIHPEDREAFTEKLRNLSPSSSTYSTSYRIRRKDTGEYIIIGEKGEAHFNEEGEIIRLSGMASDITRRKHLEEELERQNELLEIVFDTIPVMITIYDPKLEIFSFNREMKKVLGWTEDDAVEGDYMAKIYPDPEYRRMVSEYMQSLEPGWRDFKLTARDGSVVESSWSNIRLSDDRQVGIGIDIRKFRDAERVLTRDKSKLENLVRDKSKEMLRIQREINRENRLAEIGKLAASIAHELRNPLATINISSFNLKNKIEGKDLHKHLDRIRKKVEESNRIIDNLLSYSRLRPPRREKFNLHSKLKEVAREIRNQRRCTGENLKLEIEPVRNMEISADPHQLGEVFSNILNNALNAIDPEDGEVVVMAQAGNGKADVIISDNGDGIDKNLLAKVFDPFFSTRAQGTGLGLPICRQIMNNHGGSIDLASERGAGTTVTLSIPAESE